MSPSARSWATGSSPLTRGKPMNFDSLSIGEGLIPAHAGKTCRQRPPSRSTRAHPRSRGENAFESVGGGEGLGSSPLTRGKPLERGRNPLGTRLIPAHAGKTAASASPTARARAHPRSRGENVPPSAMTPGTSGSSPLTRGKHGAPSAHRRRARLIPAHAGKTVAPLMSMRCLWAHPRSRGENYGSVALIFWMCGSSPLTRGKQVERGLRGSGFRLIPAHAGKTRCKDSCPWCVAAHPRSRGENYATQRNPVRPTGSSPLTRGKHHVDSPAHYLVRLIPAHAGKTCSLMIRRCSAAAHPRSRGENTARTRPLVETIGSSPLTRGKPPVGAGGHELSGLIPAHAGKT